MNRSLEILYGFTSGLSFRLRVVSLTVSLVTSVPQMEKSYSGFAHARRARGSSFFTAVIVTLEYGRLNYNLLQSRYSTLTWLLAKQLKAELPVTLCSAEKCKEIRKSVFQKYSPRILF